MSPFHPNYYHWIHDDLLRLYRVFDRLPEDTEFIVPADLRSYQYESLQYFGFRDGQLKRYSGDEIWELESLYFSSHTRRSSYDLPEEVNWFRDKMFAACAATHSDANRRIFISRRLAASRKITNDSEVQACLQDYGFETCHLENMPFKDQVNLFARAEIILATHGAGLTNVLFAPPGAHVVEILETNIFRNVYWSLSDALGLHYWYFMGEAVPPAEGKRALPNVYIPLAKLRLTLDRVLAALGGATPRV